MSRSGDLHRDRMLAVLLVFMGLYLPLSLILGIWLKPWQPLSTSAVTLTALATGVIWGCWLLLRRGRFNLAATLFLGAALASIGWNYLHWGLGMQIGTQLITLLPPLLGALVLGRGVLWACAAVLLALVCGAAWVDIARYFYDPVALRSSAVLAVQFCAGVLAGALLLDRAAVLIGGYLGELARRNAQLAHTRDRLQLEMEERERSRRQLLHAQKMEGVGRLAGGVAHDFNHLLGLILGYAQRGREASDADQMQAMFEGVESATRRAAAVSRRLLDFSRLEASRPEVFDAAVLVKEFLAMQRHLLTEGVQLRLQLAEGPQPVFFDRAQLELVLINLASNAAEAMAGEGTFTVAVAGDADWVEISVTDTGRGMTAEELARCREPFYTTKPPGKGTGLGLSVASDLAERAGGSLKVESVAGSGTTVRLRLPRRTLPR